MSFEPVTAEERALVRDAILRDSAGGIDVFYAGDGVWTADVAVGGGGPGTEGHVYVEAGTPGDVLRRLAEILEES